jgi:exosortase/archaeosortase family protein
VSSLQASDIVRARRWEVSRPLLFCALIAVGFANGIFENILAAVSAGGLGSALLNIFDISVFVWLAAAAGLLLVARSPATRPSRGDGVLVALASITILLPVPALSWLAYTGLVLSLLVRSTPGSTLRRGAVILLAVTIPMFWARIFMSLFNDAILAADATFAAWAVGTQRSGNIVPFADGSGAMWIAPGCSSFTNISLAILAFVALVNVTARQWTPSVLALGVLTCGLVVGVNVTRISLIGYYPEYFELIHGQVGAGIAGWLTTLLIMAGGWLAVRRDAIALG